MEPLVLMSFLKRSPFNCVKCLALKLFFIQRLDLKMKRGDFSSRLSEAFFKVVRKLVDRLDIEISGKQLKTEVEELTKLQGRKG